MITVRRRLAASAGAVLAAAGLVTASALSTPSAAARPSHGGYFTGYAVAEPVCPVVTRPGDFTCMAMRQVPVAKGTAGAYRYSIPDAFRGPGGGYTPAALAKAYSFDPKRGGSQRVAIVDWNNDPAVRSNLNHFDKYYGLSQETGSSFRVVNQTGQAHPLPNGDRDASVEIALDVETVRGVCNKCKIILVEADAGRSDDLAAAENTAARLGATVISNSFGSPERKSHPYPKQITNAFNHPGVVTTVSSGDDGYFYWDLRNGDPFDVGNLPHQASFPSTLPNVVSVGGTALELNANGTRKSETVWDSNGAGDTQGNNANQALGAAGGGCSVLYKAPAWQRNLAAYKAAGCKGKRLAVDVAAVGDPRTGYSVYDTYGLGGWASIGGTSLSSPVIAAMYALAGGAPKQTSPAHALYQNQRLRKFALYDVTEGGNGWCGGADLNYCSQKADQLGARNPNRIYGAVVDCSYPRGSMKKVPAKKDPECNAQPGYDGPSGVGTPNGLTALHTTLPSVKVGVSTPRRAHHALAFDAHVKRALHNSKITKTKWTFGDHSSAKLGSTTQHTYRRPGNYRVTLRVKDNRGQHTATTRRINVR